MPGSGASTPSPLPQLPLPPPPSPPPPPPFPRPQWLHLSKTEPAQVNPATRQIRKLQADGIYSHQRDHSVVSLTVEEWVYDLDHGNKFKIRSGDPEPRYVYEEDGRPDYGCIKSGFRSYTSRHWRPGRVVKVCWREALHLSPETLSGAQWPKPDLAADFSGFRFFLIIATASVRDRSICALLRRSSSSFRCGGRPALDPCNQGTVSDTGVASPALLPNLGFDPVRMIIAPDGESLGVDRYICYHSESFTTLKHDCKVCFVGGIDADHFQRVNTYINTLLPRSYPQNDLWSFCGNRERPGARSKRPLDPNNIPLPGDYIEFTRLNALPIRSRPGSQNDSMDVHRISQAGTYNEPGHNRGQEYIPTCTYSLPGLSNDSARTYLGSRPGLSVNPAPALFDSGPGAIWDEEPTFRSLFETYRHLHRRSFTTKDRQSGAYGKNLEDDLQETGHWGSLKTQSPTPQPQTTSTPAPTYERPASRNDFEIAFICALPIEKTAVQAIFDDDWDEIEGAPKYGTAQPDTNAYSHGRIGSYNVVVANIGGMGKRHAAAAATHICHTWPKLQLILVVGICGAVPFPSSEIGEIILGDVVISSGVIQYDFGRRLDSGFVPKKEPQDLLPGPRSKVRPLLDKLRGVIDNKRLRNRLVRNLGRLETDADLRASYLGAKHDVLFRGDVRHVQDGMDCRDAGCQGLVYRERLVDYNGPRPSPAVHIGLVGSADTVMKSGSERDRIARQDGIIAFEMEGAGVWGDTPCLVIKGVCDYADGHKMKKWQSHAAAAAAAGAAAFLDDW